MILVSCHSTLLKKISAELIATKQYSFYSLKIGFKNSNLGMLWESLQRVIFPSLVVGCLDGDVRAAVLNKNKK